MIRVFIADDHAMVRAGLKLLLSTAPEMRIVGEAGDGRAALDGLRATPCDVLVLDLSLPRLNGIEVLRRAREEFPSVRVLVVSSYPEAGYALRLVRFGAAGYLSKDRSDTELIEAVRRVSQGGTYVTSVVTEQAIRAEEVSGHTALSGREQQIFLLLVNGMSISEIAAELDVTASTVSNFIARIKTKLGVKSVAEIVSYAHRAGLVS